MLEVVALILGLVFGVLLAVTVTDEGYL